MNRVNFHGRPVHTSFYYYFLIIIIIFNNKYLVHRLPIQVGGKRYFFDDNKIKKTLRIPKIIFKWFFIHNTFSHKACILPFILTSTFLMFFFFVSLQELNDLITSDGGYWDSHNKGVILVILDEYAERTKRVLLVSSLYYIYIYIKTNGNVKKKKYRRFPYSAKEVLIYFSILKWS